MKKEKSPIELVAEEMSHELHFEVTKEQAVQRLCNQYLNNRFETGAALAKDAAKNKK
jgi:hypothetical protein